MKGKRKQQKLRQEQLEEEKKELEETSSDKTDPENSEIKVKEESEEEPRPKEIWEKFKKEEPPKRKKSGLTGFAIKMIACLSMLFDHIAAVFLDEGYFFLHPDVDKAPDWIFHMDFAMRAFGRLAFPLFCFLIVEGCFHVTGNKWKYLGNLIVFGIISEIPFDLAFNRSFFDWSSQNVYFTLALGLLTIIGIEYFTKGSFMKAGPKRKTCGNIYCNRNGGSGIINESGLCFSRNTGSSLYVYLQKRIKESLPADWFLCSFLSIRLNSYLWWILRFFRYITGREDVK